MTHVISEAHQAKLNRLIAKDEFAELPADIETIYWDFERLCRKLGRPVEDDQLITIAYLSGRQVQDSPVTFLDTIKEDSVQAGDQVLAKFRNQWRFGFFKGIDNNKITIQLDDDTAEDRKFSPTSVRLPTREELKVLA